MKTPLRLLNNRASGFNAAIKLLPEDCDEFHFPFFSSGGLELAICNEGKKINGHTYWWCVQEFWECLKNDPDRLIEIIKFTLKYEYFDERFFHYMQENFQTNIDVFVRSAQFYVLNRCTEDGQIFGGKFIDTKYINKLAYFNIKNLDLLNLSVDMHEGASSLKIIETLQSDNYIVATPPGFSYRLLPAAQVDTLLNPNIDHAELASQLSTKNRWMIICNYHKKLEEIYNNYNINYFNEYWKESDPAAAKEMIIVKS